jgi:hypothetical protein
VKGGGDEQNVLDPRDCGLRPDLGRSGSRSGHERGGRPASEPCAAVVKHVLVSTFIDQGTNGGGLPKGNTVYAVANAIPFTCATSCTLEVNAMLQMGGNTTKGNLWDTCAEVDKVAKNSSCTFQGTLPIDKSFVVGNYAWSVSLTKGVHTAQSMVYVKAGGVTISPTACTSHSAPSRGWVRSDCPMPPR